ncbi:hypothetical protein [Sulfurimonas sp.]|uniref:hypothetical protein n=1 Tax=Sulfurimonas sp. TaxID=2022749 RepID=UPI0025FA09D2|nr:hypothetical protein [Sulfurimonas sp.]MCK9472192.1 hypothetical protein [Sulfurimonas sp.]MDD3504968.1 hypothetical protein [Sulfurimonas sp.]
MFKWKKYGLIFKPDISKNWMQSHAQVPYSVVFENFVRVYFSTRESQDNAGQFRSYSGYVDLDRKDLSNIIAISEKPIIDLGGLGEFDEFGSMAGSVIKHKDEYLLYYCGWQRAISTPYNWAIGLAKSKDGKRFNKIGKGPLLGPTFNEPYLQACPIVYKIDDDNWHMYYLSGTKWIELSDDKKESQYLLMHATSQDGINWKRDGKPAIELLVEDECQTSCSIIKKDGKYHMFFSYRHGTHFREDSSRGYRIGYASSEDFINWNRDDKKAGIDISESGWDSEMIAYPHVTKIDGKIMMFYCGNGFGKSGFGYAVLEEL